MKKKKQIINLVLGILFIVFLCITIPGYFFAKQGTLLVSCTNHIIQLRAMYGQLPGNKHKAAGHRQYRQLPYNKNVPGYAVLPLTWPNKKRDGLRQGLHCNHGGWQMLNLPREKMIELIKAWKNENTDFMPYLWCGKNTGKFRVALRVDFNKDDNIFELKTSSVNKIDIDRLNKCMQEIGGPPISIDIPDNIDWEKIFRTKQQKKRQIKSAD